MNWRSITGTPLGLLFPSESCNDWHLHLINTTPTRVGVNLSQGANLVELQWDRYKCSLDPNANPAYPDDYYQGQRVRLILNHSLSQCNSSDGYDSSLEPRAILTLHLLVEQGDSWKTRSTSYAIADLCGFRQPYLRVLTCDGFSTTHKVKVADLYDQLNCYFNHTWEYVIPPIASIVYKVNEIDGMSRSISSFTLFSRNKAVSGLSPAPATSSQTTW